MESKFLQHTLQEILQLVDVGIHVVDATGVTVLYNPAAAKIEGLDPAQVMGRHILDVYPSLNPESSTLLQVSRTLQPLLQKQQSFTNFKGNRITTVNSTRPIVVDGRLIGAVEVSQDITNVRELSERLVDLQARMFDRSPKKSTTPTGRYTFADLIGQNHDFVELKRQALRAAQTSSTILVCGETGTGKELLVQSIHNASPRASQPFVAQNCAAMPESLLESILFGTVRGSFTGAENRPGLFEVADGGTLFLDEIDSMPTSLQAKLLRVLQEQYVRRVGDNRERQVDVRIIAATNSDPWLAVQRGELREDLYYRISVVQLTIPPLRQRRDDLPLLTQHFIAKNNQRLNKRVMGLSDAVQQLFQEYSWPGNVRELEHVIEGALNIGDGDLISVELIPQRIRQGQSTPHVQPSGPVYRLGRSLRETLAQVENDLINQALEETGGNISQAAALLGLPRQTLQYRLRRR